MVLFNRYSFRQLDCWNVYQCHDQLAFAISVEILIVWNSPHIGMDNILRKPWLSTYIREAAFLFAYKAQFGDDAMLSNAGHRHTKNQHGEN